MALSSLIIETAISACGTVDDFSLASANALVLKDFAGRGGRADGRSMPAAITAISVTTNEPWRERPPPPNAQTAFQAGTAGVAQATARHISGAHNLRRGLITVDAHRSARCCDGARTRWKRVRRQLLSSSPGCDLCGHHVHDRGLTDVKRVVGAAEDVDEPHWGRRCHVVRRRDRGAEGSPSTRCARSGHSPRASRMACYE